MDERRWQFGPRGRAWREAGRGSRKVVWRSHLVYEQAYGPVPPGFEIHHLDLDYTNDVPDNLIALTPEDHRKLHRETVVSRPCHRCGQRFDQNTLGSYAVYCRPCKREQDRETQQRADQKRAGHLATCKHCGSEFRTRRGTYCSQRCVNLGARHARIQPDSRGAA